MNPEVLESYLVSLGFSVDQPELRKFQDGLRVAAEAVTRETHGIVRQLVEWQAGIAGAFASISGAVVGLADHVAMADQNFRLFGLRMMMGQQAARTLKMSMDALGQPLEVIAFDPETHRRFEVLQADIRSFTRELGPSFEKNMLAIRNLRFEFTRLKVAIQFLGMKFVSDLFEKFGFTVDQVKAKLEGFLESLKGGQLNRWANELATDVVPILKDAWMMFKSLYTAGKEFGMMFSNIEGLLSGDSSIDGTSSSFEKLAKAFEHVVHSAAMFFSWITLIAQGIIHLVAAIALAASALEQLLTGHLKEAGKLIKESGKQLLSGGEDVLTAAAEPVAGVAGRVAKDMGFHPTIGKNTQALGSLFHNEDITNFGKVVAGNADVVMGHKQAMKTIAAAAQKFHVSTALALGVAQQESGFNQNAKSKAGAVGLMQLEPATARTLDVNPYNAKQNAEGGVRYIAELMNRYHGNIREALAAYNAGPGRVDAAIHAYGRNWLSAMPVETRNYVPSVLHRMQKIEVGSINVNVTPGASPERTYREAHRGVTDALLAQNRRDIAQLSFGS